MRSLKPDMTTLALCGAAALFSGAARASSPGLASSTSLVQDGGFEQAATGVHKAGTPSASLGDGWTATLGTVFVSSDKTFGTADAYDGLQTLNFGGLGAASGQVSQALATTAGQLYSISFYEASDDPAATLTASFGGSSFFLSPVPSKGIGAGPSDYTHVTFDAAATSGTTLLTFSGTKTQKIGIVLDDVSVAAVPEASSLVSLGLLSALGGLGLAKRRRRAA